MKNILTLGKRLECMEKRLEFLTLVMKNVYADIYGEDLETPIEKASKNQFACIYIQMRRLEEKINKLYYLLSKKCFFD